MTPRRPRRWSRRSKAPGGALAVRADVSKQGDVKGLISETAQKFGRLDYWIIWQNPAVAIRYGPAAIASWSCTSATGVAPRSLEDSHVVGEGEIPLADLIRATQEIGYHGAYTLEILSRDVPDSLWERAGLAAVITESREGPLQAFREARVRLS